MRHHFFFVIFMVQSPHLLTHLFVSALFIEQMIDTRDLVVVFQFFSGSFSKQLRFFDVPKA